MEFELERKTTTETEEGDEITLKFVSVKEIGFSFVVKMQLRDIEQWMSLYSIEDVGNRISLSINSVGQSRLGG